jgi:hypothetical protein
MVDSLSVALCWDKSLKEATHKNSKTPKKMGGRTLGDEVLTLRESAVYWTKPAKISWVFVAVDIAGEVMFAGVSRLTNCVYKRKLSLNHVCF